VIGSSPNTVLSYAKGLQLWWAFLTEAELAWEDPSVQTLRAFLTWLATGLSPPVTPLLRSDPVAPRMAESTVSARLAAVVSFYRYQHDVHGRGAAIARASAGPARRGRYRPMLVHLDGRRRTPSSRCGCAVHLRAHRRCSARPRWLPSWMGAPSSMGQRPCGAGPCGTDCCSPPLLRRACALVSCCV